MVRRKASALWIKVLHVIRKQKLMVRRSKQTPKLHRSTKRPIRLAKASLVDVMVEEMIWCENMIKLFTIERDRLKGRLLKQDFGDMMALMFDVDGRK